MCDKFKVLPVLVLILIISAPVFSQTKDSLRYPKSNMEVRQEIGQKFAKSQIILSGLIDSIMVFLDTVDIDNLRNNELSRKDVRQYTQLLIASQAAWVNYTESMCRINEYQSRHGAQGGTSFYFLCKTEYSEERLKELRALFFNIQLEFESW